MRILRRQEVVRRVGYSAMHLWRLERQGRFPKRLRLGSSSRGACGWLESEIDAWIEDKVRERDAQEQEAVG